jgi:hypothetical protein
MTSPDYRDRYRPMVETCLARVCRSLIAAIGKRACLRLGDDPLVNGVCSVSPRAVKLHRGRDAHSRGARAFESFGPVLRVRSRRLLGIRDGTADGDLGAAFRGGIEPYGHLLAAMPERQVQPRKSRLPPRRNYGQSRHVARHRAPPQGRPVRARLGRWS